ncbi:MAG: recombinase RecA [Caldisericota bacterium]|nr:recombinase RecA [Caldisericota bacterium]
MAERDKALQTVMSQIEKQFGKGSIMRLGERPERMNAGVISTGSLSLDAALGIGGLPRGRIVEIYGPEGGGKTTLALQALAEAQKAGGRAAFIDAEHALDPTYARNIGVNIDDLIISQPDYAEQALEIAAMLVQSGGLDVFALDSVAALLPRAELEGMMGDQFVGLQARLMSQALRKLAGVLSKSQTCAIFINQLREKIGVSYGNPEVTPGGRALKFYSSVRLEVRRVESITDGDAVIGNRVKVKVVKNKMAPPYRVAQFDVIFGKGIQTLGEIVDLAVQYDLIEKSGSWYAYGGTRLGQGRDNAGAYLKEHQELLDELRAKVREKLSPQADTAAD